MAKAYKRMHGLQRCAFAEGQVYLRVVLAAVLATAFVVFIGFGWLFKARARKAQSSASAAQGRIASGESIASSGLLK